MADEPKYYGPKIVDEDGYTFYPYIVKGVPASDRQNSIQVIGPEGLPEKWPTMSLNFMGEAPAEALAQLPDITSRLTNVQVRSIVLAVRAEAGLPNRSGETTEQPKALETPANSGGKTPRTR